MSESSMDSSKYRCNPDVVLREEDKDGGLLFNPDTNQVKVVNSTGLFIWKAFSEANQVKGVVNSILQSFEEVNGEIVQKDLNEFMDEMIRTGFIGRITTDNAFELPDV